MDLVTGACTPFHLVFHICLARLWSANLVFISAQCYDPQSVSGEKPSSCLDSELTHHFWEISQSNTNITVQGRLQLRSSQREGKLSPGKLFPLKFDSVIWLELIF